MVVKLLRTIAVVYVYYPHMWLIRCLGPRVVTLLNRPLTWLMWLTTFLGAQKRTRANIKALSSEFSCRPGAGAILFRQLLNKVQNFTEWYGYPTRRGRDFVDQTYEQIEGHEHLDAALAEGRGVILLVYHFGMVRMSMLKLASLGYQITEHVARATTYSGKTFNWAAQAARARSAEMDQNTPLEHFYHRPLKSFVILYRHLRSGKILVMNGDGMTGDEFVSVPFLGGTMGLPAGPALLAAHSGALVVPVFSHYEGLFRHRIVISPAREVADKSKEAIEAATVDFAGLLEENVRRRPWEWWTWRRLRLERSDDNTLKIEIQALPTSEPLEPVSGRKKISRPERDGTEPTDQPRDSSDTAKPVC